ncbi:heme A synthase, partial [Rhizobiaceae sp. 2RAB30]
TVLVAAIWHAVATMRVAPASTHARRAWVLVLLVLVQAAIGVGTLLMQAHMHWALHHQAAAMVVLIFATAHWRGAKGAYPMPSGVAARE